MEPSLSQYLFLDDHALRGLDAFFQNARFGGGENDLHLIFCCWLRPQAKMRLQRRASPIARAGLNVAHSDQRPLVSSSTKQPHLRADAIWVAFHPHRFHLQPVFVGGVVTIQTALNIDNPLIPKNLVGFATRQSIILEFAPTFMSIIMAGKVGSFITSSF